MEMQDEVRKKLESASLEESLERVTFLLSQSEHPRPLHLGIQLALRIAKEMRDGQSVGSSSAKLVQEWTEMHAPEVVDEAVDFARQFLLKPQELATRIAEQLPKQENS
jgi:hypothetical protein